jgi:hypothetical protein
MKKNLSDEFEPLWNDRDTGHFIHASKAVLRKWRREGTGPAFIRVGHLIRYRKGDVESWLAARRVESGGWPETRATQLGSADQATTSESKGTARA